MMFTSIPKQKIKRLEGLEQLRALSVENGVLQCIQSITGLMGRYYGPEAYQEVLARSSNWIEGLSEACRLRLRSCDDVSEVFVALTGEWGMHALGRDPTEYKSRRALADFASAVLHRSEDHTGRYILLAEETKVIPELADLTQAEAISLIEDFGGKSVWKHLTKDCRATRTGHKTERTLCAHCHEFYVREVRTKGGRFCRKTDCRNAYRRHEYPNAEKTRRSKRA
jgi:hypothetical protein